MNLWYVDFECNILFTNAYIVIISHVHGDKKKIKWINYITQQNE